MSELRRGTSTPSIQIGELDRGRLTTPGRIVADDHRTMLVDGRGDDECIRQAQASAPTEPRRDLRDGPRDGHHHKMGKIPKKDVERIERRRVLLGFR